MLTFVGRTDEEAQQTINDMGREHAHMMFPLCKLEPWRLRDGQFLRITGFGVFQYVWIRVFFAIAGMFADLTGNMEEGEFEVNKFYMYEVIIVNISQSWAVSHGAQCATPLVFTSKRSATSLTQALHS